jgi:hypothetical protein
MGLSASVTNGPGPVYKRSFVEALSRVMADAGTKFSMIHTRAKAYASRFCLPGLDAREKMIDGLPVFVRPALSWEHGLR